uniref:Uncharacterized protein n=1 Tax=Molossus molossus TaxID=27622 RepID=A0A7J8JXP5_MOLMO|nr:hypothetical protein HJG59_008085 [Molossus molossus]
MLPLNTTTCSVAWNHPLKSQKPHGLSDLSTKRLFCLARYSIIAHGLAILRHGAILTGLLLTTRPGAILQPEGDICDFLSLSRPPQGNTTAPATCEKQISFCIPTAHRRLYLKNGTRQI